MNWQGRRVLVTGAGGFIGSHLTERLAAAGATVRALVHYNAFGSIGALRFAPPDVVRDIEIVAGDVRDPFAVRSYVRDIEVVFHLAALIGIPYSYIAPSSYVATNVDGTVNILEGARQAGVAHVLVTSTSETYGTAQYTPIDETHPLVAQSPYAASKIAADQMALSYHRSFELPVAVIRPFNTFGPRQSERAIIPTIVSQALFGNGEVRLGSLVPRRDLTYVADTVNGFMLLAGRSETVGRVTNLGTGRSQSIGDVVEAVQRVLGRSLRIVEESSRIRPERSEVMELQADATVARSLGWSPATSLDEGVLAVVRFFESRGPDESILAAGYRV